MHRSFLKSIFDEYVADKELFKVESNFYETCKIGVKPEQKFLEYVRKVTHGISAEITEDYLYFRESTPLHEFMEFLSAVVLMVGTFFNYLR